MSNIALGLGMAFMVIGLISRRTVPEAGGLAAAHMLAWEAGTRTVNYLVTLTPLWTTPPGN